MDEELLYNEIYEKTKDCGRTQFIKLLQQKEIENKKIKKELKSTGKGLNKVLSKRKKWKNRYYKERCKKKQLEQENQQLKEQIKQYQDPDDLTLMFMYCDEKAKDKIKQLQKENQRLKQYCCKRNECSGRLKENHKLTGYEIIRELESWLENMIKNCKKYQKHLYEKENTKLVDKAYVNGETGTYKSVLEKIKALKGSDK